MRTLLLLLLPLLLPLLQPLPSAVARAVDSRHIMDKASAAGNFFYLQGDVRFSAVEDPARGGGDKDGHDGGGQSYSAAAAVHVKWPDGVVPYTVQEGFPEWMARLIQTAMTEIEAETTGEMTGDGNTNQGPLVKAQCVRFIPRSFERHFLEIRDESSCHATLGYQRGTSSVLSVSPSCARLGTLRHLLMHVLGFRHEHERPDRDRYLQLHWDNMAQPSLFFVSPQYDVDLPYDFESVTHLGPYTGARDPRTPVMTPRSAYSANAGMRLGQTRALSASDILRIQRLYGCPRKDTANTPGATRVRLSSDNRRSVLLACDFGHGACGITPNYESGALPTALPRLHVTPGHSWDNQDGEYHNSVSKGGTDEIRETNRGEDENTNLGGTKMNQETYRGEDANKNLGGTNRNQWMDWGGDDSNLGSTKMTQETDGGDEDTTTNQSWSTQKSQETYGGEDRNTKHGSSIEKNQGKHRDDIDTNIDSAADMPKSPQWAVVVGAAPDGPAAGGTNGLDPYLYVSTRLNRWTDSGEVTVLGLYNRPKHHRSRHHSKHHFDKEKRRPRNIHKRKTRPYSNADSKKSTLQDGGLPKGRNHQSRQRHNKITKGEKFTLQDGGLPKERNHQTRLGPYSNYRSADSKKSTSQNGGLPKEHGYQTRQGLYSDTDTENPETKNGGLSAEVRALLLSAGGPGVPLVNASVFTPAFRPRDPQGKICVDLQVYQTDNYGGLSLVLHEAATTGGAASGPGVMEVKDHTGEVKGHMGEVNGHSDKVKGHVGEVKDHADKVKGHAGEVIEELHGIVLDGWTWMGVTAHVRKGRSYTLELRAAVGGGSVAIDDLYISDGECL